MSTQSYGKVIVQYSSDEKDRMQFMFTDENELYNFVQMIKRDPSLILIDEFFGYMINNDARAAYDLIKEFAR